MNPSHADSNHYALPLAISPVVSTEDLKVIRIDIMPTGADHTVKPTTPYKIKPPNEYTPEHQELRTDLKPLNVVQPEGASFKATKIGETGETIEWQKWSFRVGFNAREGTILYDVSVLSSYPLVFPTNIRRSATIAATCSTDSHFRIWVSLMLTHGILSTRRPLSISVTLVLAPWPIT